MLTLVKHNLLFVILMLEHNAMPRADCVRVYGSRFTYTTDQSVSRYTDSSAGKRTGLNTPAMSSRQQSKTTDRTFRPEHARKRGRGRGWGYHMLRSPVLNEGNFPHAAKVHSHRPVMLRRTSLDTIFNSPIHREYKQE